VVAQGDRRRVLTESLSKLSKLNWIKNTAIALPVLTTLGIAGNELVAGNPGWLIG
jgi:hypothetical protein